MRNGHSSQCRQPRHPISNGTSRAMMVLLFGFFNTYLRNTRAAAAPCCFPTARSLPLGEGRRDALITQTCFQMLLPLSAILGVLLQGPREAWAQMRWLHALPRKINWCRWKASSCRLSWSYLLMSNCICHSTVFYSWLSEDRRMGSNFIIHFIIYIIIVIIIFSKLCNPYSLIIIFVFLWRYGSWPTC